MFKHYTFAILLVALMFSVACSSARRTGSTVRDATVVTGREIGDKAEDAAEGIEEAAEVVGDKTKDAAEVVADKTTDATITSAVKLKLAADKTVEASAIDVDTSAGAVTLTGTVKSKAEADQAVLLARSVEGVKNVTLRLTISNQ